MTADHLIDITIIILNYNVKYFLEQCLMAVERSRHGLNIEVIVIDNASVDGSQSMVRKKFPDVRLVENHKNIGFARANNIGLRQAKGKYVLILNPDTLIQEDTLIVLKQFLDTHDDAQAVGCKLINSDGSFQIGSRRSVPTPWIAFTRIIGLSRIFPRSRLFGKYNLTYLDPDLESEVEVLSGSLMMLKRKVLDRIGYFDEDYFMYGEDIDLCYRISKSGGKIYYTPRTKAIHYKGESTKKGDFSQIASFYSSMLIFINKHFQNRYSCLLKALLNFGIYVRAFISYLLTTLKNVLSPSLDLLLIVLSIFVSIRLWLPHYGLERFRIIWPTYTGIWLASLYLAGAYHARGRYHIKPILSAAVVGLLVNSTFTYFFKQFAYSRVVVLISFFLIITTASLWRLLYRWLGPYSVKHPISKLRRTIIVGSGREGVRILKKLRSRPDIPYEICGFVDFDEKNVGKEIDGTEVLATIENIQDVIRIEKVDDVIFSSDRLSNKQILETIAYTRNSGVNFRIVPNELEYIIAKSSVDEIDALPFVDFINRYDPIDLMAKRLWDIVISLAVIIFSFPLVLLNLLFGARLRSQPIVTESGAVKGIPVFEGGMPFMKRMPLYLSVFVGTLSIVGTEIASPEKTAGIPVCKPGLTGLVQLKSRVREKTLTAQEKDYYHLYYLRNRSLITDLQIALKSLFS